MAVNPPQDPLARTRERRKRRAEQIRRRRIVLAVAVLALIVLIVSLSVALSNGGSSTTSTTGGPGNNESTTTGLGAASFSADLKGADSVPPVQTESTGTLTLDYDSAAQTLSFKLDLDGLTSPSNAAIYEGAPGSTGTVVYVLFAGPAKTGVYQGELASGTIDEANLTGSLAGQTIGDLVALIQSGNTYVSVGNASHPVDAIRGQIK
ncbi:MAG: CHRD domain-containing protein [Chloroflexi bacterium]|nr:CHRD domain-containing protein [Chloroflexota bacterium]MCL5735670.1 CHRD domain-containing protein [Actinomycetota bacterium]